MEEGISIIYANRNRDLKRIKASLDSLQRQSIPDFEVVFVDYGSKSALVEEYRGLLSTYSFSNFLPLDVSHLLWNKSKALNYGIKKAAFPYIFIADVDLVFHPKSNSLFRKLANPKNFFLFSLNYLDKKESSKLNTVYNFEKLKPARTGKVNGMLLAPKEAFIEINGFDEFFHFYGAEDEDIFARLENAGYHKERNNHHYFYHNWHPSFSGSEDELLTGNPRIKNIMRINERHYLRNRERKIIKPRGQKGMAEMIENRRFVSLEQPSRTFEIANVSAHVEHFLGEELSSYKGEVVKVEFFEDDYFNSIKYFLKKKMGRQTQPYISMKQVNDMLLKEIFFKYRDYNYFFKVAEDLKTITFCIKL